MHKRITLFSLSALAVVASFALAQQDPRQRPSPPASSDCKLGDGKGIHVDYSSPRAKGRKIFGGVVPYGKVWRTGANEATSFKTDADLVADNVNVPAGQYTLYTLPSENGWKLIINKQTGQWGTVYDEKQDLARIEMKKQPASRPIENFTIAFDLPATDTCRLRVEWEQTRAFVDFKEQK
jgi:Protein of unknown function (DUF2911)